MQPLWVVIALIATTLGLGSPGIGAAASPQPPIEPVIDTIEVAELVAWDFSPDGSFVTGTLGAYPEVDRWCLRETQTGLLHWCTHPAADWEPLAISPAWLPDGSAFLVTERFPHEPDIWRIDRVTGAATNLTDDGYTGRWPDLRETLEAGDSPLLIDAYPVVSPDGSAVAFMRVAVAGTDESSSSLQVMPRHGGSPAHAVALGLPLSGRPAWSQDGRWLHWIEDGDRGDLSVGSTTTDGSRSRRVRMTTTEDGARLPVEIRATLADGRLLMVQDCLGFGGWGCSSWLVDPVTGVADRLVPAVPDDDPLRLITVAASPDGGTVVALARRGDSAALELIDVRSGTVRQIPLPGLDPSADTRVRWLTHGRIILNGDRDHPRRHQVITLPPEWHAAG
jgi:hypothetical protein